MARALSQASFAQQGDTVAVERPIFVTGLPRTGTTALHRLLCADPGHQGLELWLAEFPQPRPPRDQWADNPVYQHITANFAKFHAQNPDFAGVHYMTADTVEECWQLLRQSLMSISYESLAHVPSYSAWLAKQDWTPAYERHRRNLALIGANDADKRWILKNPSHLFALDALLEVYPDAIVIQTHRAPRTLIASSCSLSAQATAGQSELFVGDVIGRTQLDLWARGAAAFAQARARHDPAHFLDVDYDDFIADPVAHDARRVRALRPAAERRRARGDRRRRCRQSQWDARSGAPLHARRVRVDRGDRRRTFRAGQAPWRCDRHRLARRATARSSTTATSSCSAAPGCRPSPGSPTTAAPRARCAGTRRCSTRRSSRIAAARHRYWARSYLGWRSIATARPNSGHRAVADLQAGGRVRGIITQNVDGLHQAAGALDVIELHGGLDRVVCLDCGARESRFALDARLRAANPDFDAHVARVNPDGDVDLADEQLTGFRMVLCTSCTGSMVKPDVVFFGENVPKPRVDSCYELVEGARSVLVLGSSLTVMSGLRFVRRAARLGVPVAIVNQGATRGDEFADVRVDAPLGEVLPLLV